MRNPAERVLMPDVDTSDIGRLAVRCKDCRAFMLRYPKRPAVCAWCASERSDRERALMGRGERR